MKNESKKGSVLIASLWALSIFSVLMTSLTFEGFQHTALMKRELNELRSKAEFQSALALFTQALFTDPKPHEDSKEDSWYGVLNLPESWKKELEVTIRDEESKINLNFASEKFLIAFLKTFEENVSTLQMETKDFVKKTVKLRTKGRISSYEELYLLEDVEQEGLEKLEPYMTVYPETAQMNINTIDPLVLKSLIRSLSNDHFAEEELFQKIIEYREKVKTGEAIPLTQDDLTPDLFERRLGLSPKLTTLSLVNRFLPFMTTDSRTYHLKVRTQNGKEARAIVKDQAELGIQVLSWNET